MAVPVLKWNGAAVRRRVARAAAVGIDETMEEGVRLSKAGHPDYPPASAPGERYASRTGSNVAAIRIKVAAVEAGTKVSGLWGSDDDVSLFLEIGTSRKNSGAPRAAERAAAGGGDMWAIPPPASPPQMAARLTLRPSAQVAYTGLARRIAIAYEAGV